MLVQGERRVCDPNGIKSPNEVGNTLFVGKTATVDLSWTAPAVDPGHDAAVFYKVWVSGAPAGGFVARETPMIPSAGRPLTGPTEFYLVSASNGGGSSSEAP